MYKDPHRNPASFKLVKAKAARDAVPLEAIPETDPCSIVLICPQDQQDEDLRIMMGRWVMACCVNDGKSLSVPDRMWRQPGTEAAPDRWSFDDALGEPIRGASVEIWLTGSDKAGNLHRIRFGQWAAPESGIETIQVSGGFHPSFVVSHSGYGKVCVFATMLQTERIRTQLVPLGSEAQRRGIWGTVVDELGRAVQDARIEYKSVRTLGEGLINPDYRHGRSEAITDANGFFALYMPPGGQSAEQRGTLIPPGSRYQVVVKPPASTGLATFEGSVPNGTPAWIVLAEIARGRGRFSDFTDEQWSRLEQLGVHPLGEEDALKPVREVYGFLDIVRTDAQGRYEVRLDAGADIYGLVFFSRGHVPVQYRKAGLEFDAWGRADVPVIRLYPAARVGVQVETALERVTITARWRFKEDQVPPWARDLCARPTDRRPLLDRWLSLESSYGYAPNTPQWVFIPADVPVQLEVAASHKDQLCPFTYPQSVCLSQGERMDLGPCTLQEALPVILQVMDRRGRPREGVPVARRVGDAQSLMHTTDENGLAAFYVPPYSSGEFFVFPPLSPVREGRGLRPEAISFEVGGTEDQGKQFTLAVSDEMLAALFKDGTQSQR